MKSSPGLRNAAFLNGVGKTFRPWWGTRGAGHAYHLLTMQGARYEGSKAAAYSGNAARPRRRAHSRSSSRCRRSALPTPWVCCAPVHVRVQSARVSHEQRAQQADPHQRGAGGCQRSRDRALRTQMLISLAEAVRRLYTRTSAFRLQLYAFSSTEVTRDVFPHHARRRATGDAV
jgi:hypothetical protein